jgi:excinuclease ABC subunit A
MGTDYVFTLGEGKRVMIGFPLTVSVPAEIKKRLMFQGFARILQKGDVKEVSNLEAGDIHKDETVDVIVDRVSISPSARGRVAEALDLSFSMSSSDEVHIVREDGEMYKVFRGLRCPECGRRYENLSPLLFSFNSPYGACPECRGFGNKLTLDLNLIIPNRDRTLAGDAIEPWSKKQFNYWKRWMLRVCDKEGIPANVAFTRLSEEHQDIILHGKGRFPGVIGFLERLRKKGYKAYAKFFVRRYLSLEDCPACRGTRLKPEALNVKLGDLNIAELSSLDIGKARAFFEALELTESQKTVAADILGELDSRFAYLMDVGLDYLTLDRQSKTLSGGEAQRINLSTALGAGLTGTLYVLDEPTIGLHARDTDRLLGVLKKLRSRGNTVLVVEHDPRVILGSDHVIDLGPGAGAHGGEILFKGKPSALRRDRKSITAKYLSGKAKIECDLPSEADIRDNITVLAAAEHNLKQIDVRIPLYSFVCVTGVSGSGKSSLVEDIIYNAVRSRTSAVEHVGAHEKIEGIEKIRDVVLVDQSPIGKTPRSNPITYVKGFDAIRSAFAQTRAAKRRGYTRSHFSFNVQGGRCEMCKGEGSNKIEMHFLADIYVPCEECFGRRYKKEILEVYYNGKNISDVLNMTVDEALYFFRHERAALPALKLLKDVGLGYITLGQPANTLSGGESQRLKIAREIGRADGSRVLYLMDEPTTGLHLDDIANLVNIIRKLVRNGNTVVVIEHNLEVIKCADYIIDLGPEGGDKGGYIVAEGPPERVARFKRSHTGRLLRSAK